jgi:hypothetical protein
MRRPTPPCRACRAVFPIAEGDVLFNAIKTRLRLTISEGLAAATEEPGPGTVGHVLSSLLECVFALEQLQLTLAVERGRRPPS